MANYTDAYIPIRVETSPVNLGSLRYSIQDVPIPWKLDNSGGHSDLFVVAISEDGQIVENISSAYLSYDNENGTLSISPVFGEKDFCAYIFRNEEAINLFAIKADGNASLASILAQFEKDNRVLKQLQALQGRTLRAPDECNILPDKPFRAGKMLSFDSNGNPAVSVEQVDILSLKTYKVAAELAKEAAEASAGDCSGYAATASAKANEAALAETNAYTAMTAAQSAQINSETAADGAYEAKLASETAKADAETAATTATTKASEAGESASAAAASADAASIYAQDANGAKNTAELAKEAAGAYAADASGYAATASTKATQAITAATEAATSASFAAEVSRIAIVPITGTTQTIQPNKCYTLLTNDVDAYTLTPEMPSGNPEYLLQAVVQLKTGNTAPVINWGGNPSFFNGKIPTINADSSYDVIFEFDNITLSWSVGVMKK